MVRIGPWAATVCFGETDRFFVVQKQGGIVVGWWEKMEGREKKRNEGRGLQDTENLNYHNQQFIIPPGYI